jgi:uncharacterized integral membrane protein
MNDSRDDFEDQIDESSAHPRAEEPLGIAWGFIAFLLGAALLAVFVIQNTEEIQVEFLFWDVTLSVGVIFTLVVLVTLIFDQLVSFLYRRSKRKKRAVGTESVG